MSFSVIHLFCQEFTIQDYSFTIKTMVFVSIPRHFKLNVTSERKSKAVLAGLVTKMLPYQ